MGLDFVKQVISIGGATTEPTLRFYRKGFNLGGSASPSWQDIILDGNGSLTLANAKANGLNYLKLFGSAEQDDTPTPTVPVDIVCNNGVIKFGEKLTLDSTRYYAYLSVNLTDWSYSNDSYSIVVPVTVGKKYKITVPTANPLNNTQNTIFRYAFTDSINTDWTNSNLTGQTAITAYDMVRTTPQDTPYAEVTAAHPYLIIQMGQAAFSYILANNLITVTDQTIYTDGTIEMVEVDTTGDTATAEMLLKVNTYQDVQEVLTGSVTRNVGVKVFDGSEVWSKITNQNAYYIRIDDMLYCNPVEAGLSNQFVGAGVATANMPDNSIKLTYVSLPDGGAILFKHNDTTTLEDWVQFVADQYNSGNPIIAIYPLAEPATESVTAQPLSIQAGTNIVEITQGSINNLPLEVSYKGSV